MHRTTGRSGEVSDADAGVYVFDLIGPFQLKALDGGDFTCLGRKARGLLTYLAFNLDSPVPRERLMALLWSERGEDQARASLRQCLYELRPLASGAAPVLGIDRHHITLASARIEIDLARFDVLVAGHDAATLAATLERLTRPLVEDLDDLDPAFDEWLSIERTRHEDRQVAQLCAVIRHALGANEAEAARDLAMAVAVRHPADEEVARLAMTASHACGQRDAMRRILQRLEAALRRDLAATPSPETTSHLERLLKAPPPALSPPAEAAIPGDRTVEPAAEPPPRGRPGSRRLSIAIATLAVATFLVFGTAFLVRSPRPIPGDMILVRSLQVPSNDTAAQALRQGLAADLARAVVGKDTAIHIAEEGSPTLSDDARHARFILEGEARTGGSELRATVSLRSASSHEILWSGNFSLAANEADALRQQAAVRIAEALTCALSARHRSGAALADGTIRLYLTACDATVTDDPETARKLFREVTALAPDFSRAWSAFAASSSWVAYFLDGPEAEAMGQEARAAAARALELDPHNGQAYYARAIALPGLDKWLDRVAVLRAGLAVEPDNPELNDKMAEDLASVGRLHEALVFTRQSVASDPLSAGKAANLIEHLAYDGRIGEAQTLLGKAERLWPRAPDVWGARLSFATRFGDPADALAMLNDPQAPNWMSPRHLLMWKSVLTALHLPSPANVDAAIAIIMENAKGDSDSNRAQLVQQLIILGHLDDAFALAERSDRKVWDGEDIWFRVYTAPFRADPRFMPLAYRQGLVDIWMKTGKWPDFCLDKSPPYDCEAVARRLVADARRTESLAADR
jgi:DNA-binding SARP family transcriptional activator/TolB-like protein